MKKNNYLLILVIVILAFTGVYLLKHKSVKEAERQSQIGTKVEDVKRGLLHGAGGSKEVESEDENKKEGENKDESESKTDDNKVNWKEKSTENITFKYPESIKASYVSLNKWPPEIKIISNNYPKEVEIEGNDLICKQTPKEESFYKRVYEKTINGREYCIKAVSEGAAGSTYTTYNYSTIFNGDLLTINFVLQFPNCGNYPEAKRKECNKEREGFNMYSVISDIVETIPDNSVNYTREQAICDYLLTQREFGWKTGVNGRNFCVIKNLGKDEMFPLYIWARCSEFVFKDGKLKKESGSSLPVKVNYPNELSFYDLDRFSYSVPRDGSGWDDDVREMFPKYVQDKIFNFQKGSIEEINQKLETKALNWFENN